jgi:hypothetical protein
MAMGKRKHERQEALFVASSGLAKSPGHPFYRKLNEILAEAGFDRWIETSAQCRVCIDIRRLREVEHENLAVGEGAVSCGFHIDTGRFYASVPCAGSGPSGGVASRANSSRETRVAGGSRKGTADQARWGYPRRNRRAGQRLQSD